MNGTKIHFGHQKHSFSAFYSEEIASDVPAWKRALDCMCILLALPAMVPLMAAVACIIKTGSRGPVLFQQKRVGLHGSIFTIYKFRTMFTGASTTVHEDYYRELINSNRPMEKLDTRGDSRLIPLGRWLRVTGLDELPQIFNVLRGEMSLIGPRPCLPSEYERYLPWQKERFDTVPGLTGLWQVNGKNRTTFDEMIRLDIHYVRNKSLWLDIKILFHTLPAVLMQVRDLQNGKLKLKPLVQTHGSIGLQGYMSSNRDVANDQTKPFTNGGFQPADPVCTPSPSFPNGASGSR